MLTLLFIVSFINLSLTFALILQAYPEVLRRRSRTSTPLPIPLPLPVVPQYRATTQPRIEVSPPTTFAMRVGGNSSIANGVLSYWQNRGVPGAEPFVAMFFKDSGIFDGIHVPPDSYIVLESDRDTRPIPAPSFEDLFEQAAAVSKVLTPLSHPAKSKTVASELDGTRLSEDDAKKLAEEYELVEKPTTASV